MVLSVMTVDKDKSHKDMTVSGVCGVSSCVSILHTSYKPVSFVVYLLQLTQSEV